MRFWNWLKGTDELLAVKAIITGQSDVMKEQQDRIARLQRSLRNEQAKYSFMETRVIAVTQERESLLSDVKALREAYEKLSGTQSILVSDCSRLADENITMRSYINKIASAIHGADINPFGGNGVSVDAAMNEIIDSAIALNHQLLRYRVDSEKLTEVQKTLKQITETWFSGVTND